MFLGPPVVKNNNISQTITTGHSIKISFDKNLSDKSKDGLSVSNGLYVPAYQTSIDNGDLIITPTDNEVFIPGQTYTITVNPVNSLGIAGEQTKVTFTATGSTLDIPDNVRTQLEKVIESYAGYDEQNLPADVKAYFIKSTDEEEDAKN